MADFSTKGTLVNIVTGMQSPFNISIYPSTGTIDGFEGDHVLIAPAYNVTSTDVNEIADTVTDVIYAFFHKFLGGRGIGMVGK
jgi:hypothetical protein